MQKNRIIIVDVLRGVALLLIVLIHFVEHFELFKRPDLSFLFSQEIDEEVMSTTIRVVSGKAYSIFAILFGLSFFIQMNNNEQKGVDFSKTFIRRMIILLTMGFVHSLIYRGDILHMYALLAFPIVFLDRLNTRTLVVITIILIVQIPMIYQLINSFIDPEYRAVKLLKSFNREASIAYAEGSLMDVISYNVWQGRSTVWAWSFNNGRVIQLLALFIVGLILGRIRFFERISELKRLIVIGLILSVVLVIAFNISIDYIQNSELVKYQKRIFSKLIVSYKNLSITTGIIAAVLLVYDRFTSLKLFQLFAAYGKYSLTNYVFQALFGVVFFYGFGLGMYRYLGSTWSLLLGVLVFVTQSVISIYWNKKFYYGPLEWCWRCLTYKDFSINNRRLANK